MSDGLAKPHSQALVSDADLDDVYLTDMITPTYPDFLQPISADGRVAGPRIPVPTAFNFILFGDAGARGFGHAATVTTSCDSKVCCEIVPVDPHGAPLSTTTPAPLGDRACKMLFATTSGYALVEGAWPNSPEPLDFVRAASDGKLVERLRLADDGRRWATLSAARFPDGSQVWVMHRDHPYDTQSDDFLLDVSADDAVRPTLSPLMLPFPAHASKAKALGSRVVIVSHDELSLAVVERNGTLHGAPRTFESEVQQIVPLASGNVLVVTERFARVLNADLDVVAVPIALPSADPVGGVIPIANGDLVFIHLRNAPRGAYARVLSASLELRADKIDLPSGNGDSDWRSLVGSRDTSTATHSSALFVFNAMRRLGGGEEEKWIHTSALTCE